MKLSHLSAVVIVGSIMLLFPGNAAIAQDCSIGTDTERILCKMDSLSQEVADLHVKIDSIEALNIRAEASDARVENWVSPAMTLTSEHCVEMDYLDLGIDVGMLDFDMEVSGAGRAGGEFYGSGGWVKGEFSLDPFQFGGGVEFGAALNSTHCFNMIERIVDPGPGFVAASKSSVSPRIGSNDLRDMIDRSTAIENSLLQEAPSLVSRLPNPANLPGALNNMMGLIDIPASPSDAISGLKNTLAGIPDILSLPPSVANLLNNPLSILDTQMDFEEICNMASVLEGEIRTTLRKYCAEATPIPDPSVFIADAVRIIEASEGTVWVANDLRNQWDDVYTTVGAGADGAIGPKVNQIWDRLNAFVPSDELATNRGIGIGWTFDRVNAFTGGSVAEARVRGSKLQLLEDKANSQWQKTDAVQKRLNAFVSSDADAGTARAHISTALQEIDFANRNLAAAKSVIDDIRSKMGDLCGSVSWCSPERDDLGLEEERIHKSIFGSSGSDAEEQAGKLGINGEEEFHDAVVPDDYFLNSGYPNPAQSSVRVEFGLPQAESVRLRLFDTSGREVQTGIQRALPAGRHSLDLSLSSLASGTYFYRIEAGPWVSSKTITVNR